MANQEKDDGFVENKTSAPTSAMLASPEDEFQRLRKLSTADLVNELFFARQKLRTFLEEKGIPVPELTLDTETHKTLLDLTSSVFLENFSRSSIRSIGEDVESVNSSVKSFVMLFDSLISTNSFEQVMVSVEGSDEPCTVKKLLEDYDNNRVDEDRKVVISVHDLHAQLGALIDEDSSGNKTFDDVADTAIAETRNTQNAESGKTYHSRLGQGAFSFGEYSPFISQEAYDSLFSAQAENADHFFEHRDDAMIGDSDYGKVHHGGDGDSSTAAELSAFDDNAEIPKEQEDVFDDFYAESQDGGNGAKKPQENLSAEDIDKLIGSM